MLPFTKRPGRDESGDNDVVTRDDIVQPPASIPPPPVSKRSVAPSASSASVAGAMRPKFVSAGEEEMTTLMSTKSLGSAVPSPRPAAGAPPQSRPTPSSRPLPNSGPLSGPPSARSGKFAAIDEEEDGRTVVRGAPKIVKRTGPPNSNKMGMPTSPTTISPAAVIKASLDAARAGIKKPGDHLMAGPPSDLLEDLADRSMASSGGSSKNRHIDVGAEHTAILQAPPVSSQRPMIEGVKALSTQMMQPQPLPHGTIPPGSARPQTNPPPPNSSQNLGGYASQSGGYASQSGGYASQSGGYQAQYNGSITGGSSSVPGVQMPPQSMPAHFMVPQAPYSDGRIDPPGTAVTARTKVSGRPAMSWALALAAFGVFVGVGAVAAMNGNEGFAETSASFVDPSRAAAPKAAAGGAQAATPGTPVPVAVAANGDPAATVGVPPIAVPGAAPPTAHAAAPADPGTVAAPVVTTPSAPAAPAAPAAAAPAAPAAAKIAAAAPAQASRALAAPAARPQPQPRPAAPAAEEKEPVAAAPATKAGKKGAPAGKGGSDVDEETKKALDALQKSQLESSF